MRIIKKRGNELATVLVSTYLHQLRWCATHFMQRYDFLRNMQNTFDFSFQQPSKTIFRFRTPFKRI